MVASERKLMRKLFRQATEHMFLMDLSENSTSPPFVSFFVPFSPGHIGSLQEAAYRGVLGLTWVQKPKSESCANANFVYL